jgi:hypothetical protein
MMTMDSMMGGVMGLAWVLVLIALLLVIGGIVYAARPKAADHAAGAGMSSVILTTLAIVGGIALVAVLAMGTMHLGMRCC